jgi:limonene-1,2-epoxide hydrolase
MATDAAAEPGEVVAAFMTAIEALDLDRFRFSDLWIELPVARLFHVVDGRISLWRDYFDQGSLMSAMAALDAR